MITHQIVFETLLSDETKKGKGVREGKGKNKDSLVVYPEGAQNLYFRFFIIQNVNVKLQWDQIYKRACTLGLEHNEES